MKGKSSKYKKWHLQRDIVEGLLDKKTFEQGPGQGGGGESPSPWISGEWPGNGRHLCSRNNEEDDVVMAHMSDSHAQSILIPSVHRPCFLPFIL